MMSRFKNLLKTSIQLICNDLLFFQKPLIRIFNYHQIGERFDERYHSIGTFTNIKYFEEQMKYLKKEYKVIHLVEAINRIKQNKLDGKYACITFDDGDVSLNYVVDILSRLKLPATFFINSSYLGNASAGWINIYKYIKFSPKYSPLLDNRILQHYPYLRKTMNTDLYQEVTNQIISLFNEIKSEFKLFVSDKDLESFDSTLFSIGLHGSEHHRFSMMDENWQKQSLEIDIKNLSKLNSYIPVFAIPFGRSIDWNIVTIKAALNANIDVVFADGGTNYSKEIAYKRIPSDGRNIKYIRG